MDKHLKESMDLVEKLLQVAAPHQHKDTKAMLLWQRGFLTGLLSVLIRNDSLTRREIILKIQHYLNKQK